MLTGFADKDLFLCPALSFSARGDSTIEASEQITGKYCHQQNQYHQTTHRSTGRSQDRIINLSCLGLGTLLKLAYLSLVNT
jgi:hypothetical protein